MKSILPLVLALCTVVTVQAGEKSTEVIDIIDIDLKELFNFTPQTPPPGPNSLLGATVLGVEFIGIPAFMLNFKGESINNSNPFLNVEENEPYLQDKVWHFVGAAAKTELNYRLLNHYFSLENPAAAAGALSFAFWTLMECFDGLTSAGFSVHDQIANTLGMAFGIFNIYYPDIPIRVRIGVESWGRFFSFARSGFDLSSIGTDYYSIFKTELIYVFENDFYAGISLTKGRGKNNHSDRFGITVGYDIFGSIEENNNSWWAHTLAYFRNYLTLSVGATYWIDEFDTKL
ncbi:hypothetical protein CHISP_3421 [Chitinispirillum alkaliphilum]|nr:hypothetical protein CHISP_3421 [Chitinispirillum alkaliphilum]